MAERKEKFAVRILDEQKKAVTKEFNRKEIEEIISKFLSNTLFTFPGIANICNTTEQHVREVNQRNNVRFSENSLNFKVQKAIEKLSSEEKKADEIVLHLKQNFMETNPLTARQNHVVFDIATIQKKISKKRAQQKKPRTENKDRLQRRPRK